MNNTIDHIEHQFKNVQSILKNYLPILRLEGGDLLIINLNEEAYGHIMVWEHETDELLKISDNFDSFLNLVAPYDLSSDEQSGYKVLSVKIDPEFLKELENNK